MTTQEHLDHLLKLNKNEKVSIVQLLWDSIASDNEPMSVSQEEKDLLDERKEQYDAGKLQGNSWKKVKERLLNQ